MIRSDIGWISSSKKHSRLIATLELLMGLTNGKDLKNSGGNAIQILEEIEEEHIPFLINFFLGYFPRISWRLEPGLFTLITKPH